MRQTKNRNPHCFSQLLAVDVTGSLTLSPPIDACDNSLSLPSNSSLIHSLFDFGIYMIYHLSKNYPLVNIQIAMEHGHRNSGFSHDEKIVIFHGKMLVHQRVYILANDSSFILATYSPNINIDMDWSSRPFFPHLPEPWGPKTHGSFPL